MFFDSPMEEELERAVGLAAGCVLRLIVGDDDASVGGLLRAPLPSGRGWWCVVLCVSVLVRGFVCVVVSASACLYHLLLFLK
jgi:hypothetical protein